MKSSRLAGALWIVLSAIVFAGCGGGGGGHIAGSDDGNGGGGGDSSGGDAFTGVAFTEDTTLDDDITGLWVMISDLEDEPQTSVVPTVFSGIKRRSFAIVRESDELSIISCLGANNIVETDTSIEFEYDRATYTLEKDSNTHLSGSSVYSATENPIGQITMIKVGVGPELGDLLNGNFSLGLIDYSVDGEPETFKVKCYSDERGTESFTEDGVRQNIRLEGFRLTDHQLGNFAMEQYLDEDYSSFYALTDQTLYQIDTDTEGSVIEVTIGGSNSISIDFNVVDGSTDGTTIAGSAELELNQ